MRAIAGAVAGLAGLVAGSGARAQVSDALPDQAPAQPAVNTPAAGVQAAASIRRLTLEAFPGLGGVKPAGHRPITGVGPRPRALDNTRSNWIPGWSRIPDLPQVYAKIASTNRVISRREAERNPEAFRKRPDSVEPRVPMGPTRAFREQDARLSGLRDAARSGDAAAIRDIRARLGRNTGRVPDQFNEQTSSDEMIGATGSAAWLDPSACAGGACGVITSGGGVIGAAAPAGADPALVDGLFPERRSDLERAADFTNSRDFEAAADAYLRHMAEHDRDADAARALALVILAAGKTSQACDAMLEAYRLDAALAFRPVDPRTLPPRTSAGALLGRVAQHASRTGSAGAWLTAAMLAQASGKQEVAARFVQRSRGAGLDATIADALTSALAGETEVADAASR